MQPALGGTIKAYRLQRDLGQKELCRAAGWGANPSRLSRYEQGRILPSRSTLDRISQAQGLEPYERGFLLLQGGYLPADQEVAQAWEGLRPFLEGWPGPGYLADFGWRFLGGNEALYRLFGFPPEERARLAQEKPTLLDLTFDPRWAPRRNIAEEVLVPFGRGQIARFKAQQRWRTGQRWYRKLLQRLLGISLFRELWHSTTADLGSELMDYNRVQVDTPGGRLDFHMFASALVGEPRLFAILWLPADEATARLFP